MKKGFNFRLIAALVFILQKTASYSRDNDLCKDLEGKVRYCVQRDYYPKLLSGEWTNDDVVIGRYESYYRANGNAADFKSYNKEGKLWVWNKVRRINADSLVSYYYDRNGVLYLKSVLNKESDSLHICTVLDEKGKKLYLNRCILRNGRIIETKVIDFRSSYSKDSSRLSIIYNLKGDPVEKISENGSTRIRYCRYEYLEFDPKGNWTRRLEYDSPNTKEPSCISIRKIAYYK